MDDDKDSLRLAAIGDVMLDREVGQHFRRNPDDFSMAEIQNLLEPFDLVFANLENPVSVNGVPHPLQDPHVSFCASPDTLDVLKNIRANVVSLGNNHILDFGAEALATTLEYLDAASIRHVGAGRDYEEANRPLLMECKGRRIAILSYVFVYSASTMMARGTRAGVSDHRIRQILARICQLKQKDYVVIVSLHWGVQYCFYPLPYQMRYARKMIDAGALLILGHGPHYPQGIETYKNGLIVYSLGNFIFDEPYRFSSTAFIIEVRITEKMQVRNVECHPFVIKDHVPQLLSGHDKERFLEILDILTTLYQNKDTRFWQNINRRYFLNILWKAIVCKSIKFITLYPASFYFYIGLRNIIHMVNIKNLDKLRQLLTSAARRGVHPER